MKTFCFIVAVALALYIGYSFFLVCKTGTIIAGEFDDYSAPTVSLLNDGNFTISKSDLVRYGELFPEWKKRVKSFQFSGFKTRWGGELTWYFPFYSIIVLPLTVLLPKAGIPATYTFCLTNFVLYLVALFYVGLTLRCSRRKRLLMVALLAIHPIAPYLLWASAEVFIFSLLTVGMASWYNRQYYRATFFTAIASMLNFTIFVANIFICLDFLYRTVWKEGRGRDYRHFLSSLLLLGSCTLPAFIPAAYNLHHTGYANLTAAYPQFLPISPIYTLEGFSLVFARFQSYLFDLNYGFFPFFPMAFPVFLFASVRSAVKHDWEVLKWVLASFGIVAGYSVMVHVNCDMSGIARYSSWGSVVFLFALLSWIDEWLDRRPILSLVLVAFCVACSSATMASCGFIAPLREAFPMNPIAKCVLDYCPCLYSPYRNTFYYKVAKKGSSHERYCPKEATIYSAEDGYVRKVLATEQNRDYLEKTLSSRSRSADYIRQRLATLGEKPTYLSFPRSAEVEFAEAIPLGEALRFGRSHAEGRAFFLSGLSQQEEGWTWTDGKEARMRFRTAADAARLSIAFDCAFFKGSQRVIVESNGVEVFNAICGGEGFHFEFDNPGAGEVVNLKFSFPDAASPAADGGSNDTRMLAVMIKSITVSDITK